VATRLPEFESQAEARILFVDSDKQACAKMTQTRFSHASSSPGIPWGDKSSPFEAESLIRPYIFRLRRKLGSDPRQPRIIRTIRGQGHVLIGLCSYRLLV